MKKFPGWLTLFCWIILTFVLLCAGTMLGSSSISLNEWFISGSLNPIIHLRFLRMCAALVVGASLALSGMTFQAVLRNPLAEPFTLGISGGAGVGAAFAFVSGIRTFCWISVPLFAFIGAILILFLVLMISRCGQRGAESLLLSGVIVGTIAGSLLIYLLSIAQLEELSNITWWLLGDLQGVDPILLLPGFVILLISTLLLSLMAGGLNALSLGNSEAWNLGIEPRKMIVASVIIASFLAAQTVAMAGIIGFCGLIIPHIVRRIWGCNHKRIVLLVFFAGASFLMFCDILSRVIHSEREIPIGVITSLIGGPFFLWIINRRHTHDA